MQDEYTRTVQQFVEDLFARGRTATHIIIVAQNTQWKNRISEVKSVISEFSGKFSKKFTDF